jgi:signal transduction histidine kinase
VKGLPTYPEMLKQIYNKIKTVSERIAPENWDQYRQFFLASDTSEAAIVTGLITIAIALLTIGDFLFFGLTLTFYAVAAVRVILVLVGFYQATHVGQVKNYRTYDRVTLTFLLTIVVGLLLVNLPQTTNLLAQVTIVDIAVFVFYLVLPTRLAYQAVASTAFSAGEATILLLGYQPWAMPSVLTALFSILFANVVAAIGSWQIHSYRRRIFLDFSARKEAERLIVIGQTAGMVGHDIRNPLQAIVSELYITRQAVVDAPDDEIKQGTLESIAAIQEQVDYISKIVADLQDYARPLQPMYQQVDVPRLISSSLSTINIPSNIVVTTYFEVATKVRTDPTFIRRILTNLVINAIQAMPTGGKLTITAKQQEKGTLITVEDTGKGISEENKPKLFTPLFTTKSKGQGFGLAVTKRLIEALKGEVKFESQEGKGTKFLIELPNT